MRSRQPGPAATLSQGQPRRTVREGLATALTPWRTGSSYSGDSSNASTSTVPLLVGHSLGAGVAAAAALAHPRDVAGVVFLDGDALASGGNHGWLADLIVYPYYTAAYRIVTGSDWIVGRVFRNALGPPPHPNHATLAQFERPFRVQGTEGALKQLLAGGLPGLTLPQLAQLRDPRAVIWGANDTVDSVTSGRAAAAALHTHLQTIPQAGHLSMLARPQATANRILHFLRTAAGANRTRHR